MDTPNTLYAFYQHRAHSLVERTDAAGEHLTDERIRRVRVGIKRLRSLYRLMQLIHPLLFRSGRHERVVRKLFKRAGQVREYQVSRDALPQMAVPAEVQKQYRHFLERREHKARRKLKKALRKFRGKDLKSAAKLIRRLGRKISPAKIDQRLRTFTDREATAIETLQALKQSSATTHEMRKHLKSLIDVGTLLMQLTTDDELARLLTRAKQVQTQLGNWHDKIVLLQHLEAFLATDDDLPTDTAARLIARQKQLATRQEQRSDQFNHSLTILLNGLAQWRVTAQKAA